MKTFGLKLISKNSRNFSTESISELNFKIKSYLEIGKHHFAKELFKDLISKHKLKPNDETISIFLNSYLSANNFDYASNFLKKIKNLKFKTINEEQHLEEFFQKYAALKGSQKSLEKLSEYQKNSFFISPVVYFSVIQQLIKENNISLAMSLFRENIKMNSKLNSLMMDDLIKKDKIQEAQEIYQISLKENILDVNILNSLLKLKLSQKDHDSLRQTFENDYGDHNIKKDIKTFSIALHSCFSENQPSKAAKYYKEMKQMNLKPNLEIYFLFIEFLSKNNKMLESENILNEMIVNEIVPPISIMNLFLEGYMRNNQWNEFSNVEERIKALNLNFNQKTFNLVFNGNIMINNEVKLRIYLNEIQETKFTLEIQIFPNLLEILNSKDDIGKLFNKLPKNLNFNSSYSVIKTLSTLNEMKWINKIINDFMTSNHPFTEISSFLNELLKLFHSLNQIEMMSPIVSQMLNKNHKIEFEMYQTYIMELLKKGDDGNGFKLFKLIPTLYKTNPTKDLYIWMIKALYEKKKINESTTLLQEMESIYQN
jgi:pentatricopeptide repeat protein